VDRAEALKGLLPAGMTLPEMALRFVYANDIVSTTIVGMRNLMNVESNIAWSDGRGLPPYLLQQLRPHRWDRKPAPWAD
jgi:aryl-alcohol dehydrogenase-like predicted oxidoreductase